MLLSRVVYKGPVAAEGRADREMSVNVVISAQQLLPTTVSPLD